MPPPREGVGAAVVPGAREHCFELVEAAPRHIAHELVAIAEMPVGRRRADPGPARRLSEGEAGGPLLRDQFQRRVNQGLFQVAVVVAARA